MRQFLSYLKFSAQSTRVIIIRAKPNLSNLKWLCGSPLIRRAIWCLKRIGMWPQWLFLFVSLFLSFSFSLMQGVWSWCHWSWLVWRDVTFVTCFLYVTGCMVMMSLIVTGLMGRDFCDVFSLWRRLHDHDVTDRDGSQGTWLLWRVFFMSQGAWSWCHLSWLVSRDLTLWRVFFVRQGAWSRWASRTVTSVTCFLYDAGCMIMVSFMVTGLKARDLCSCCLCVCVLFYAGCIIFMSLIVTGTKGRDLCDVFSLWRRLHDPHVADRDGHQRTWLLWRHQAWRLDRSDVLRWGGGHARPILRRLVFHHRCHSLPHHSGQLRVLHGRIHPSQRHRGVNLPLGGAHVIKSLSWKADDPVAAGSNPLRSAHLIMLINRCKQRALSFPISSLPT